MGKNQTPALKDELIALLKEYKDIFAWTHKEMPEIYDLEVIRNTMNPNDGTLGPSWEGPYRVEAELKPGTFKLRNMQGKLIKHTWNAEHLKKYYP